MADETSVIDEAEEENPSLEPKSSKLWLSLITDAEKVFRTYQEKCDNIDKLYADLARQSNMVRDREFAIFWANIQVLGPSIYSRPPVPVVVPRFKDRRPVPRTASELLERSTVVAFELEDIDEVMRQIRDDLNISARGAPWVRYEAKGKEYVTEKVCIEHVDRKDFLHDPARKWKEVGWVAKRSWLTKKEMRKRFAKFSGKAYLDAEYTVHKEARDNGAADNKQKAGVWEIWSKTQNKVVWVTEGCEVVLDENPPHLKLEGFYPCTKPAFGTTQRRSLVPVPDMVFYKDQLEEINELTARISSLSEAVKVRGFYPAGAGEIGDAIEAAIKATTNNQVMVPISNWAAFGNSGAKDMIVWLPIDMIVKTIVELVALRKQIIEDVYQITGLSDIMRGSTDPNETLGAQELKSQFGSVRVRDKQAELVRVARDIARLVAEIMAENFSPKTLLEMSQMEIPTKASIAQQVKQIIANAQAQVQQAMADPQLAAQAKQNPEMAEQMLGQLEQQVKAQIDEVQAEPTIEDVMGLLREQKLRPFVLDIETDSTIQPNEDAEKQRTTEFLTALGGALQQLAPMVAAQPQTAGFAGEILKFTLKPFRAGREMEGQIDEFVDQMKQQAGQDKPNPEAEALKAEQEMKDKELQGKFELEKMKIEATAQGKRQEQAARMEEIKAEAARDTQKHQQEMQKGQLEIVKLQLQIEAMKQKAVTDAQAAQVKTQSMERQAQISEAATVQKANIEAKSAEQQADIQANAAEQSAQQNQRAFEQKSALTAQQAAAKSNGAAE